MSKIIVFTLVPCLLLACSADFEIKESYIQAIEPNNAKTIALTCYCPNEIQIEEFDGEQIILHTEGKYGSQGYHGEQEKPSRIPESFMKFNMEMAGDTLKLVSNEWTMLHHYFVIEEMKVSLPKGREINVKRLEGNSLEGRAN